MTQHTNKQSSFPVTALICVTIAVTSLILPGWARAEGSLSGTVVDAQDGVSPVHPVWIWLWDPVNEAGVDGLAVNNNPDGTYLLENIPEGSYKVIYDAHGAAEDYIDELYDDFSCQDCNFAESGNLLNVTTENLEVNVDMVRQTTATVSPAQLNYPYFEDDRWASNTGLAGKSFQNGFSFSGWFNFLKLPGDPRNLVGFDANSLVLASAGNGDVSLYFNQTEGAFLQIETDQWVNLAVTANEGQVRFYKNGELQSEFAVGDSTITFGDFFSLGFYWGYAKQLKIWEFALTQEQLQAEIAVASSTEQLPVHQWLMDEGVGSVMRDTGSVGGADINYPNITIWKHANSPYEILLESEIKVYDSEKPIPTAAVWGSADFDQDGTNEVFIHGGNDDYLGQPIPMLVLQVDENNQLVDKSAELIDGGLYYRYFGSGRKTVVADFNNDGYNDIFAPASSGHFGVIIPEPSILLMSDGASGRLFPADDRIKSPPCTLSAPAYEGQKPCQTSDAAGLWYPDESAELVDMEIRSYGHGADVADIDGDGDLDLLVITVFGAERDELPVSSYFLINDGNGNFTANWQLVPHKAATYYTEWFEEGELPGMVPGEFYPKDEYYSFGVLRDFDVDGHLDMALLRIYSFAATLRPPDGPFDVETENAWQSVYELIAWGSAEGFSEEYTILESVGLPSDAYRGTNTEPLPMDIDGDGDIDLIINRDGNAGGVYPGSYLQIFRNEGDRIFVDATAELLPQEMADISVRPWSVSLTEHDLNQDGCPDFIAMQDFSADNLNGLPPFRIWLNDCNGGFRPIRDSLFGKVGLMIPLDLDNDGGLDFVSINSGIDDSGKFKEATILKQVAPIDVRHFTDRIFLSGFE